MRFIAFAALIVLFTGASEGKAADVDAGGRLAQRWCTACHVIGNGNHGQDAAPALPPAAPRERSQEWLRAWLTNPHPPMPDLHLSRMEIEDLVAYLASLPQK